MNRLIVPTSNPLFIDYLHGIEGFPGELAAFGFYDRLFYKLQPFHAVPRSQGYTAWIG